MAPGAKNINVLNIQLKVKASIWVAIDMSGYDS